MKKTNIFMIIALIVIIVLISALGYGYYKKATLEIKNPIVTMEVEGYGTIKLELYPEMAPNTVANFVNLAQNGYYNNVTFHRVVKDFMIQGGGNRVVEKEVTNEETGEVSTETSTESISPKLSDLGIKVKDEEDNKTYCIKGEFVQNGFNKNTLKHEEGVISMARADYTQSYSASLTEESYNSGSAQFFIMTKDNLYLDGSYTAFGKVIEGMDVVHAIEGAEVQPAESEEEEASTPVQNIIIRTVTVDTQGGKYNKPQTLDPFNYNAWVLQNYGTGTNS